MMASSTFILEVIIARKALAMSLYERDSTMRHFDEVLPNQLVIEHLCAEAIRLMNKTNVLGPASVGLSFELKKIGRALFDQLLSETVKVKLIDSPVENLIFLMDEALIPIPWELLHNGQQFLCLQYNVGRSVRTKRPSSKTAERTSSSPIKMLVMADPIGDLDEARAEAFNIRQETDQKKHFFSVTTKLKKITVDYVIKNLQDYDIVHFAGHNEFDYQNPLNSGWKFSDGLFRVEDVIKMKGGAAMPLLIFSNACQSAVLLRGQKVIGETGRIFYGIANAFLLAGVKHFLGTLWEIPDQVAAVFSREFYAQICEGMPIGTAIREARLKIIRVFGEDTVIWSSYVLYGDPSAPVVSPEMLAAPSGESAPVFTPVSKQIAIYVGIGLFTLLALAVLENVSRQRSRQSLIPDVNAVSAQKKVEKKQPKTSPQKKDVTQEDIHAVFWPPAEKINQIIHDLNLDLGKVEDPKVLYEYYRLLIDSYAMVNQYRLATLYTEAVIELAKAQDDKDVLVEAYLECADVLLEEFVYFRLPIESVEERGKFGDAVSKQILTRITGYYQEGMSLTVGKENVRQLLRAYQGLGRVYKYHDDNKSAIAFYEKAVEILEQSPQLPRSEVYQLAYDYVELATLYLEEHKAFDRALVYLSRMVRQMNGISPTSLEDHVILKPVIRKFDLLLRDLHQKGLSSTQFYPKAMQLYRNLNTKR